MEIVLSVTLFFLVLIIFELVYSVLKKSDTRSVDRVVERYSANLAEKDELDILYYRKLSDVKLFNTVLSAIPAVNTLDELMQQGGVKTLAGVYILFTLTAGAVTFLICLARHTALPFALVLSAGVALLPFLYLLFKRKQRRAKFESLFPDAIDLMCYSLKAGHSILSSFKMVSEEIADPVAEEFARIVEEINFGKDIDSSLRTFSRRIDSVELKFFVTSVIIQRETGSNLVEMLEKISDVIRRKFRFREKIQTLSAEGKLSAGILLALPFLAGTALMVMNPEYISVLFSDPLGPYAMGIAATMMCTGAFIMYRMVQLDL
ncbi:MAG: type II secretion system F family protein [Thermodesulfobacteriota bacterium]|nr:type II secretion system F family protein [Thermodesulfobacteriota bacterium]